MNYAYSLARRANPGIVYLLKDSYHVKRQSGNLMVNFLDIHRAGFLIGIMLLILINGGCGSKKIYTPPENGVNSKIILINPIYEPGFYIELDKKEVGFLKQRLEIKVNPGKHKLKLFNTETTLSEKEETTIRKFDLMVEISQGEVKKIVLTWDDQGYSSNVRSESREQRQERKEKSQGRTRPGMSPLVP